MTDRLDPIETLPGGQFIAACADAVEQECWAIRRREDAAAERGQGRDPERMRHAALLAAAADMLGAMKREGDRSVEQGQRPPMLIGKAVLEARATFQRIDLGPQREAA